MSYHSELSIETEQAQAETNREEREAMDAAQMPEVKKSDKEKALEALHDDLYYETKIDCLIDFLKLRLRTNKPFEDDLRKQVYEALAFAYRDGSLAHMKEMIQEQMKTH